MVSILPVSSDIVTTPRREDPAEVLYRLLDEHGWASHFECGWDDGLPPADGMCGKEWAERDSLAAILADPRWTATLITDESGA